MYTYTHTTTHTLMLCQIRFLTRAEFPGNRLRVVSKEKRRYYICRLSNQWDILSHPIQSGAGRKTRIQSESKGSVTKANRMEWTVSKARTKMK